MSIYGVVSHELAHSFTYRLTHELTHSLTSPLIHVLRYVLSIGTLSAMNDNASERLLFPCDGYTWQNVRSRVSIEGLDLVADSFCIFCLCRIMLLFCLCRFLPSYSLQHEPRNFYIFTPSSRSRTKQNNLLSLESLDMNVRCILQVRE